MKKFLVSYLLLVSCLYIVTGVGWLMLVVPFALVIFLAPLTISTYILVIPYFLPYGTIAKLGVIELTIGLLGIVGIYFYLKNKTLQTLSLFLIGTVTVSILNVIFFSDVLPYNRYPGVFLSGFWALTYVASIIGLYRYRNVI